MSAAGAQQRKIKQTPSFWLLVSIIGCYSFVHILKIWLNPLISWLVRLHARTSAIFSRFGLQATISFAYVSFERSFKRLAFFGILPIFHLLFVNPHIPMAYNTAILNATLQAEGFSMVARQESFTGYISVLDSVRDGYRAMRCDHSLLGGEWINKPKGHPAILNEPIYAIFVMLEAVRLVETESVEEITDDDKRALVM